MRGKKSGRKREKRGFVRVGFQLRMMSGHVRFGVAEGVGEGFSETRRLRRCG